MFCALQGQDIRRAFTGPPVLSFFMLCLILFLSLQMDISEDPVSSGDVIAERPNPLQ